MDSAKSAVIYYSAAFLSGLVLVSFLIHVFQWPVTASLVFGVSLFIQYMYLSRKVFQSWLKIRKIGFSTEIFFDKDPGYSSLSSKIESDI